MQTLLLGNGDQLKVPFPWGFLCCVPRTFWLSATFQPLHPPPAITTSGGSRRGIWRQKLFFHGDALAAIGSRTHVSQAGPARYLLSHPPPGSLISHHTCPPGPRMGLPHPALAGCPRKPQSCRQPLPAVGSAIAAAGGHVSRTPGKALVRSRQ